MVKNPPSRKAAVPSNMDLLRLPVDELTQLVRKTVLLDMEREAEDLKKQKLKEEALEAQKTEAEVASFKSEIDRMYHKLDSPAKKDPFLELPVARSVLDASNDANASPFATLTHNGGSARWPWSLDAKLPAITPAPAAAPKPSQSKESISQEEIDPMFRDLLQQRLDDAKGQLAKPGLTQSMKWYLETEIRRIEGRLKEAGVGDVSGVKKPEDYTKPFCHFLTENPTVFHAVEHFSQRLIGAGFKKLSGRSLWTEEIEQGGKYFVERNGSSLIAFIVGESYKPGNGIAMIAGHVDALTARLKPVSAKKTTAGYLQLGVAPYAGALNTTWWDRDLGIGGRVLVKDLETGKITTHLVKLGWPIARIPTLAPHFGEGMLGTNNAETQAVPIIGLDLSSSGEQDALDSNDEWKPQTLGGAGTFVSTQPPKLVRAIAGELNIQDYSSIINWELELFDTQPAAVGGIDKEFIFAGRIDDKLCSWSAMEGFLAAPTSSSPSTIKLVGLFDDEEIGSLLRQGAKGNFLPGTIERIIESLASTSPSSAGASASANLLSATYANSFLLSADVVHAVNPNFLSSYLPSHAPHLNVGVVVSADSNGHMTTDAVSTAFLTRIAELSGSQLQVFMIRNDSRSGGTVGPMLSSAMGVRAIDAGIPQLSMHSIRATTGARDPGLGVKLFAGFFEHFEQVDAEFV